MNLTAKGFRELFWDTDPSALDEDRHATWILERILERGTLAQWREARDRYGRDRLLRALQSSRRISRKSAAWLAACLDVPVESFAAWENKSDV